MAVEARARGPAATASTMPPPSPASWSAIRSRGACISVPSPRRPSAIRVQGYIQRGIDEGATLLAGGLGAPEGGDVGFYVRPTVFSGVTPEMTIAHKQSGVGYEDGRHGFEEFLEVKSIQQ